MSGARRRADETMMFLNGPVELNLRSYAVRGDFERHAYAQLVLPVLGGMEMQVGGDTARLGAALAAFVPPGVDHRQAATGPNRFLIVDLAPAVLPAGGKEALFTGPFAAVSPAMRRLIDYAELTAREAPGAATPAELGVLLLRELARPPASPSRLAKLLAQVEQRLDHGWTVAEMASLARMSPSRLHARFRDELGVTPAAWLSRARLRRAQELLCGADLPVAEIALLAGYSDQSALTRAMSREAGLPPAAYRRACRREPGSRIR